MNNLILWSNFVQNHRLKVEINVQKAGYNPRLTVNNFSARLKAVTKVINLHNFSTNLTQPFQQLLYQNNSLAYDFSPTSTSPTITTIKIKFKERNNNGYWSHPSQLV